MFSSFPLDLQSLGWQYSEKTDQFHFLIKTSAESGVGLDFSRCGTITRWEWFLGGRGVEITEEKFANSNHETLRQITSSLLPFGYEPDNDLFNSR